MSAFIAQMFMEGQYQLRRPFVWICAAIYFAVAFGDAVQGGLNPNGLQWINGADAIITRAITFSLFGILAAAGIMGEATARDRHHQIEELVLVNGAKPAALGGGRFVIAWLTCAATSALFIPGTMLGSMIPGIPAEQLGPVVIGHYVKATTYILIPNFFIVSAWVFLIGTQYRNQTAAYLAAVALLILWVLARMLLGQDVLRHDVFPLFAMLDPFGSIASAEFAMERTIAQNNTEFVPFRGYLLWNRLLWSGIAAAVVTIAIIRLPMRTVLPVGKHTKRMKRRRPPVRWTALHLMVDWEARMLIRHPGFKLVLALMGGALWFSADSAITHQYSLPTTDLLIHNAGFYFDKILILMLAWTAGDLIWRERELNVDEITDVLPTRDTTRLVAKTTVLLGSIVLFWMLAVVVNILYQIVHGFYRFELDLYLLDSLLFKAPQYFWYAILALTLQIWIRQRFVALGVFLLVYVSSVLLDAAGFFHPLYRFAEGNFFWYSPMDGYGHFVQGQLWMTVYWALVSVLLWLLAWSGYSRGRAPLPVWSLCRFRLSRDRSLVAVSITSILLVLCGATIWWQSTVLSTWPPVDLDKLKAEVEKKYGDEWRHKPQPRVVRIDTQYDIYPRRRTLLVTGDYTLENRSDNAIQELLVLFEPTLDEKTVRFARGAQLVNDDLRLNVQHWSLASPIQPGERIKLHFTARSTPQPGLRLHAKNDGIGEVGPVEVIGNGTSLLNLQLMPVVGYTDRVEHKPRWKRLKYGLSPTPPPLLEQRQALYQAHDTLHIDWVEEVNAVVTTLAEQTPLHSGRILSDEVNAENNRRRIHYRIEGPSRGWSEVISAQLEKKRIENDGIPAIEFFYDPKLTYTLDEMSERFADALRYFQSRYGQAPFETLRMAQQALHFDGMGNRGGLGFATEILGWKSNLRRSNGVVIAEMAAHMMGMSWFGDQIIPANLPGAKIIHAGLPYWTAGLYLNHVLDPMQNRTLRKQILGELFRARRTLDDEENSFMLEQKDSTMIRRKGMVLMNYLAALIGPAELETAFADFLERWRYRTAPYPTAADFYRHLKNYVPARFHAQLEDIFQHVTRWDLRAVSAVAKPASNGQWQVEVIIETRKYYTGTQGHESEVEFNTPVFVSLGDTRSLTDGERQLIYPKTGRTVLTLTSTEKPKFFGLDADYLLPDTNLNNQIIPVTTAH